MIDAALGPRLSLGTIDLLLRDRDQMMARIKSGNVTEILRTMTITIAVAMAVVGAALGSYRGGVQIAYAAIKLPLVILGTAALSAPALTAIGAALGRRARLAHDLALVISALAFGALLLAAFAPIVMLCKSMELPYHHMVLMMVAMFGFAGLASLKMIVSALAAERGPGWRTAVGGLCIVFVMVGGQLSWALRPYLVRPQTRAIPFVREVEGSLFDAVITAARSANGIYDRASAPLPWEDRR